MDIIIRNIPENMIDKLDNIAKAEDLSRNALLTKLISDFVKSNDDFVVNILPPIVRALVNQELDRLSEGANSTINNVYIAAQKMINTTEKIENLLTETITNPEENSITNEEILRILEISEKENS
ncbi:MULTISPECIES: ribbon-helix-helix domain-containing protein [Ruminococcus]|jgi:hypothetical protein|uniref:Ribbon-helix-helix domain-containing protein n=1 Tax=Ruminococcus bicirculans (ex Wegman et al. 2014) TaxID=1160721 RepID=A0AAW5KM98_9FIRM|nr:ribbon-helix-helix domain-containing protein [Ruminococcus bicirculans (ex Wegman et al. 2014)]MCQ5152662.1 ribbon-helix-helix domain-containing protein [Ruminococcus bicirculans (ex Wegman et al. 2014)]